MTYEQIQEKIQISAEYSIINEKDTGNGKQIVLNNGAIINCFA